MKLTVVLIGHTGGLCT